MAVSEETLDFGRTRSGMRPGRRFLLAIVFALTAAAGVGAVLAGLAAFHESEIGRILPGVSVAGVDVGGLTADEARTALRTRLADLSAGAIAIHSSAGSTTVAFADVARTPDIDGMVGDALSRGRGGTWFDETIAAIRLRMHPEAIDLRLGYEHDRAAALVAAFVDRTARTAIDASVVPATSAFVVLPSVNGLRLDATATMADLDRLMRDPATRAGAIVQAPIEIVSPALNTDQADSVRVAAAKVAAKMTVTAGGRSWDIGSWKIRPWISFSWVDGVYRPIIDRTAIPAVLKSIAKTIARPVRDAEFLRDKRGRIVGSMADRSGRALDVPASVQAIASALETRFVAATAAPPVNLAVTTIAPKRTTQEAAKAAPLMVMLGSWTTYYQVAAHNGFGANITVPTRVLNGSVVAPGAVFDFWANLGEVSLRTGYKLGGAIVGGHSVEGKALAGGICAASTTLFNAALRSGFEILARESHWYYITRYPLGLDATVSGSQTMRFRNDTPNAILIRGYASPGIVRYEIWSVPNGRTVSLSRPQVSNVVAGADSTVKTTSLSAGQTLRTEWPVDGKDVVVTRTVRDATGRVIHQDTFVTHYHRMIGILQVGIG